MTPLHYTAHKGHVDSLNLLLDGGADAKIKDKFGRTVLHWAIVSEKIACITALCSKISQVDICTIKLALYRNSFQMTRGNLVYRRNLQSY